jgi:hypothetical protein
MSTYINSSLPIGAQQRASSRKLVSSISSIAALEDRIAALEKDIEISDSEIEDSEDNEDFSGRRIHAEDIIETSSRKRIKVDDLLLVEMDKGGNIIRYTSSLEDEKIEPLASSFLPGPKCSKSKSVPTKSSSMKSSLKSVPFTSVSKQKGREPRQAADVGQVETGSKCRPVSGLEATVLEMLRQYEPADHRPLWCRVCRFQATSEDDLMRHRVSDLHLLASEKERKLSYCKLCHKQFTSPFQLEEHLIGKAHVLRRSAMAAKSFTASGAYS